jgi:hypothetical protein
VAVVAAAVIMLLFPIRNGFRPSVARSLFVSSTESSITSSDGIL